MDYDLAAWRRLAKLAVDRRNHHGWSQADVAARGGVSLDTVQSIESARREKYWPRTLRRYERGMLWAPNSVEAVLEGRHATALEGDPPNRAGTPRPMVSDPVSTAQALKMLRAVRAAFGRPAFEAALAELRAELDAEGDEAHGASGLH
ncbi:helix-turn-helix domain-containing protein [Saccharothrix australiensis]|uniref:Helix-turn-helix protein n=1 Tax=Saccharothrix australiensis TaxID=2072 RepID=A0A495VLG3_9PSEU|nr:helix-turn-helix transcriptional regulator [Saccharothrix australiensis]RKT49283.1 helix-turn-helix protein [Saccharothrix australiensis]